MSDRLKIMACGYVDREGKDELLIEVQLNILDTKTNKRYNVFCESVYIDQDAYRIKVCGDTTDDVIDECILDSSGGVFMDDEFRCDKFDVNFGDDLIELITNHFIIPF